jgi:hypothetical protein
MMQHLSLIFCIVGAALHLYTAIFQAEGGPSLFLFGWFLWSCTPYFVALVPLLFAKKPALAVGYAAASLGFDIFMFLSVFMQPTSSTAALGLIVMPFWNLVLFGPAGAFFAWLLFRMWLWKNDAVKKS